MLQVAAALSKLFYTYTHNAQLALHQYTSDMCTWLAHASLCGWFDILQIQHFILLQATSLTDLSVAAGVDFVGNIRLPHIDFATVHCYPGKLQPLLSGCRTDATAVCCLHVVLHVQPASKSTSFYTPACFELHNYARSVALQ